MSKIGISAHLQSLPTLAEIDQQLNLMHAAGIHWVRLEFPWANIEPSSGTVTFTASNYDYIVAGIISRGMEIIGLCPQYNIPTWVGYRVDNTTPASPTDYAHFVNLVLNHFTTAQIGLYEMGNEPNENGFWGGAANPAAYTTLLQAGYNAVKAKDTNLQVISAGLANASPGTFLSAMYTNGAHGYMDYIGMHPYFQAAGPDIGWGVLDTILSIMTSNGDGAKQIMVTEVGWSTQTPGGVTEDVQAANTRRVFQVITSGNYQYVAIACIYDFLNDGTDITNAENNFGIVRSDYSLKPAYYALQVTAKQLILYGSSVANGTLTHACNLSNVTGGSETSVTTTMTGTNTYGEVMSQGGSTTGFTSIPAPTGHGWVYSPGAGTFAGTPWFASVTLSSAFISHGLTLRFYKYSTSGTYTLIGTAVLGAGSIATKTVYPFANTGATTTFSAGDLIYIDLWWFDASTSINGDNPIIYVSSSGTAGVLADMQVTTSAFTPLSLTYRATIADSPVFTIAGTLQTDSSVGRRAQASFSVYTDASTRFQQYQRVAIYDQLNTLTFSGYITGPQTQKPGFQPALIHNLTCADQHFLADKRIIAASYVNSTHAQIAQSILNSILSQEGVTLGAIVETETVIPTLYPNTTLFPNTTLDPIVDPPVDTLPTVTFGYCTVAAALDAITTAASDAGVPFYWDIDQNKKFWFVPYTYVTGRPISGAEVDMVYNPPTIQAQNPTYRNGQYILGGTSQTQTQTETRVGDGNATSWTMGYALAHTPTITVNGASRTVGVKGVDSGKAFYWNAGDPTITQDASGTKLTSAQTLQVVYIGQFPTVISAQNNAQISYEQSVDGSTGLIEEVETDATITSLSGGYAKASQLLTRYAQQGTQLQFSTLQTGYAPGQLITVNLPDFGLNNVNMLIETVSASDQLDGFNIWYTITAIMGPYDQTWVDFFEAILRTKQNSTSVNVGVSQTLALVQPFTGSVTTAAVLNVTGFACPLPNTTLNPNTTLFPC